MAMSYGVIDVGTNTVRLLVGRPRPDGTVERVDDQSVMVRLGQGVDQTGQLAEERMERAAEAITMLAARARAGGIDGEPAVIATSAVRDAANAGAFVELVRSRSGLTVEVISGDREVVLTFRGALLGRSTAGEQMVADIGGGSTEVILAHDGVITLAESLQLGSGRLTERCLTSDPPTTAQVAAARAMARAALERFPRTRVPVGVLVGGTASALLRLTPRQPGDDRLTRLQLERVLDRVLDIPSATLAGGGAVDADRARVMPGGVLVVEALFNQFMLDAVFINKSGIREGMVLEQAARRGQEE